jgi:TPR repeat protein
MAVIDLSAISEFEIEARSGKPAALYQLGLAYSTGQGVPLDLVTAHKFFNLAAMKGVDEARSWRSELAQQMSSTEVAEAQKQARVFLTSMHQ